MTTQGSELAMNGGTAVRTKPLPQEWCGAHHYDDNELEMINSVIKSRSPFRFYGFDLQHHVDKLEDEFKAYSDSKYALAVSSGTAALQVALTALDIGPGDEVIVPGYFWVATVGSVVRSGAIPVLADVDDTFTIDPDKLEACITPRTKAVTVVHMGGVIGRIDQVVKIARKHNLKVLEDCAQATGASQKGKKAGTFGDMGIFSFQLNKHMTAGEGGMLITSDDMLFKRACAAHDLGYARNDDGRLDFDDPMTQLWGIGARMSELTGAVARAQLKKLDRICGNMRCSKNRIIESINDIDGFSTRKVIDPEGDAGSFLLMTFDDRDKSLLFTEALRAEGIVADENGMYPIHMDDWGLHVYYNIPSLVNKRGFSSVSPWDLAENAGSKEVGYDKGICPNLDSLLERTMIICIGSTLTTEDEDDIITAIRKVADSVLG